MAVWPIDDTTETEEPLHCHGCGAIGSEPCERWCPHYDPHIDGFVAELADRDHDEQASSDADPWEDIF